MDRSSIRQKIQDLKRKLRRTRPSSESDSSSERSASPKRRRIRVISTDSSESEPDDRTSNVATDSQTNAVDDVFTLLGEDTTLNKEYGEDIHSHLAVRWNNILAKGLKKERRTDLLQKYLPPGNCTFLDSPKLNDEIKAAVQDSAVKRDEKLVAKQSQLGAGIACLGRALDVAFKLPDKQSRDLIVKHLGDAGQILCDLHYLETITRRSLLTQGLNKNVKESVKDLTRDKFLFGESLAETLKAIKACSRSATDIKTKPPKPPAQRINDIAGPSTQKTAANPSLNWRGPSRRTAYQAMTAGGYRVRRQPAAAPARRAQPSRNPRPPPSSNKRY